MSDTLRARQYELQATLHTHLRGVREFHKALAFCVRDLHDALRPAEIAAAVLLPDGGARIQTATSRDRSPWDEDLLAAYLRGERPRIPDHLALAPVERRDRNWAVLAVHDPRTQFTATHRQLLFGVAQSLSDILGQIDASRLRDIRNRIEIKIADHQDPRDVIYDILHGLRQLTRYDHSSALFLAADGSDTLRLTAEQIAWTKAKSLRIGTEFDVDPARLASLEPGVAHRFEREAGRWTGPGDAAVAEALSSASPAQTRHEAPPPEVAMIVAPIVSAGEHLGILKLSARRLRMLGEYETGLVREFLPLASLAVQFSRRTVDLQEQVLQSERKHVLANLTRGISHDVNNALGSMLPLVQQIRVDAERGELDPGDLIQDLGHIERSIQTCRRIFGGMLTIARGGGRPVGQANLRRALDSALSVVEEGMRRRGVAIELELPGRIPEIGTGQNDLTQLLLNLCTNASDAMPRGGTLTVAAVCEPDNIRLNVSDTGEGMPKEVLERVFESFYSTRIDGNGLGLTICNSVVRGMGGAIDVESRVGEGTTFRLRLPVAGDRPEDAP